MSNAPHSLPGSHDPHHDDHHADTGAHEHGPEHTSRSANAAGSFLALVGLIILFIIVLWGLYHLASLASPLISRMFSSSARIEVSAPSKATAGTPLPISWKHTAESDGIYKIKYDCLEGVKVIIPVGSAMRTLPCDAYTALGPTASSTSLIALLSEKTTATLDIEIAFVANDATNEKPSAKGDTTIAISSSKAPVTAATSSVVSERTETEERPTQEAPSVTKPSSTVTSSSLGAPSSPSPRRIPDLAARIIAVGVIDQTTGLFVARPPYATHEVAAVQFEIQNIGTGDSGTYTFEATIPTSEPYTYYSQPQASLTPGSRIVNTLRFTPAVNGYFAVTIDRYNAVSESNESNNTVSQWVNGAVDYNYEYQQYPYGYPITY